MLNSHKQTNKNGQKTKKIPAKASVSNVTLDTDAFVGSLFVFGRFCLFVCGCFCLLVRSFVRLNQRSRYDLY